MSDKLTLKLNGEAVSIAMDDNGRYCLNDVYKASGEGKGKMPSYFFKDKGKHIVVVNSKKSCTLPEDFDSYVVLTGMGRSSKTFAPLNIVYKYASFISKEFENAVYDAFTKLSTGNVQEAANIASAYTLTPEIINKYEKRHKQLMGLLKETYPDNQHIYSNINRLLCKVSTAYAPKELTGGFNSAVDHIKQLDHMPAMNAYIAAVEIMLTLITAGVTDYHIIASALQVKTTKNGSILKVLN